MVELIVGGLDPVDVRLREALDAHGLQVVARSDHAAGNRAAGDRLAEVDPNVVLICGNVHVSTRLMKAAPRAGIELPL
jgi:uncharacterized protein (DUF302 family)